MVVDKFDSTLDRPTEGPAKPEDERIEVEEVGTTVDLDSSGEPNVEIVDPNKPSKGLRFFNRDVDGGL